MQRTLLCWLCLLLSLAGATAAKDTSMAKDTAEAKLKAAVPHDTAGRNKAGQDKAEQDKAEQDKAAQEQAPAAKQLSGMSIVGNDEAPKSLFIIPWKQSQLGTETSLNKMLTESAVPVDREEFLRQLDLYEVSTNK